MRNEIIAEGVAAFVVSASAPDFFLGVTHEDSKEISGRLGRGLQLSFPTETKYPKESDPEALRRLFGEEIVVPGAERMVRESRLLCISLLPSSKGKAKLAAYLLVFHGNDAEVSFGSDNELTEVGWVNTRQIKRLSSEPSWKIRPGLAEAVECYSLRRSQGKTYLPRFYDSVRDFVPHEVYSLQEEGLSERAALSRLGLLSPDAPRPWGFDRSLIKRQVLLAL